MLVGCIFMSKCNDRYWFAQDEASLFHVCMYSGHKFLLVWDASRGDYMYDPGLSPCQQHLEQTSNFLGDKLYFPKDMLSRFLANIHYITYYKQSS